MPRQFKLKVRLLDGSESEKHPPLSAAERKQLSRKRKSEQMNDEEDMLAKESERMRIAKYRENKKSSEEGRHQISKQYKSWNSNKRDMYSRQKKQYIKQQDRLRKQKQVISTPKNSKTLHDQDTRDIKTTPQNAENPTCSTSSRSKRWRQHTNAKNVLKQLSPKSKTHILKAVIEKSSPRTKLAFSDGGLVTKPMSNNIVCNLQNAFRSLPKHDNVSNATRSNLLKGVAGDSVSGRGLCRLFGVGRTQATNAVKFRMAPTNQWQISLRQAPRSSGLSDEVRTSVLEFYYRPEVSRELPGKREQITIINQADGSKEKVPRKILEITLTEAYKLYCQQFPDNKIGQRSFELLRPRDVQFAKPHHREVCCCTYHTNLGFMLKSLNQLSINAGSNTLFSNVHALVDATLCEKRLDCILRTCKDCGTRNLSDHFHNLKCRRNCESESCIDNQCMVSWESFEKIENSSGKKQLAMITKKSTIADFLDKIKQGLQPFSLHRFMAGHQHEQYRLAAQNLQSNEILVIMDYAENYSMIVPHEVQSLHWVNVQATIFVVVLTRHSRLDVDGVHSTTDNPKLVDEHHLFISDDRTHDSHMIEHCKKLLLQEMPFKPSRLIEFCDGASSQFKCIKAFAYLAESEIRYDGMPTIRYWWETSHGKHKADGAGGVIKNKATMAVIRREELIRDPVEFYRFCVSKLSVIGQSSTYSSRETKAKTIKRKFYYVSADAVDRSIDHSEYRTVKGTRSLHEARSVGDPNVLDARTRGCSCYPCMTGDRCLNLNFVDVLRTYTLKGPDHRVPDNADGLHVSADEFDDEDIDDEPEMAIYADMSEVITENSIAVIRADEEFSLYYLLKVSKPPHNLEETVTDSYGNTFEIGSNVVCGNYFELVPRQENIYYIDQKIVYVMSKCLLPTVCPSLLSVGDKKVRGRMVETYKVTLDVHEELLSFLM